MIASIALITASCSNKDGEANEEAVESTIYSLDTEGSSLEWKGMMDPTYFHMGTVGFSKGSLTMEGDEIKEGSFTVDMSTILNTDLEDEEKAASLVRHLKGLDNDEHHKPEDFFNIQKFPTAEISVGEYKDGKLSITLTMMGKKIEDQVAVKLTSDMNNATISGDFTLDLTELNLPGLQPNPETGKGISPVIDFKLNLQLKK